MSTILMGVSVGKYLYAYLVVWEAILFVESKSALLKY